MRVFSLLLLAGGLVLLGGCETITSSRLLADFDHYNDADAIEQFRSGRGNRTSIPEDPEGDELQVIAIGSAPVQEYPLLLTDDAPERFRFTDGLHSVLFFSGNVPYFPRANFFPIAGSPQTATTVVLQGFAEAGNSTLLDVTTGSVSGSALAPNANTIVFFEVEAPHIFARSLMTGRDPVSIGTFALTPTREERSAGEPVPAFLLTVRIDPLTRTCSATITSAGRITGDIALTEDHCRTSSENTLALAIETRPGAGFFGIRSLNVFDVSEGE